MLGAASKRDPELGPPALGQAIVCTWSFNPQPHHVNQDQASEASGLLSGCKPDRRVKTMPASLEDGYNWGWAAAFHD